MRNYKIIGLTGPSGAGKSSVADILKSKGFAVINADELSRKMLVKGSIALRMLALAFGDDIINKDGEANRRLIAERAFSSKENTKLLNEITHPQIYMLAMREIKSLIASGFTKIVFDAPTLFESNGEILCDFVLTVTALPQVRLQRIMSRDDISEEQARQRLSAQHTDDYYISQSDAVIYNNGDLNALSQELDRVFGE